MIRLVLRAAASGHVTIRVAPVNNRSRQFSRHLRQVHQQIHGEPRCVEIQLRRFIHEPERSLIRRHIPVAPSDNPKRCIAKRHRLGAVVVDVRQRRRFLHRRQHVADVTRRAGNRGIRLDRGRAVIRSAQLEGHRVCKIKRQGNQPERDPKNDDEDGAALSSLRSGRRGEALTLLGARHFHCAPPAAATCAA